MALKFVHPVADGLGAGDIRADVRASLAFGHRHPGERPGVVVRRGQARLPFGGELGSSVAQRRNRGVGHRNRAHDPGVRVAPQHEQGGADDMATRSRLAPGETVDLALDRPAQQRMPRGVELHLVDPVSVPVVGAQDRQVPLGAPAVLERVDAARGGAGFPRTVHPPAATLALEPLAQGEVDLEQVDRLQRGRLIQDLAGGFDGVDRGHL